MEQFLSNELEWSPPVPQCPQCHRAMQENKPVSTPTMRQFLCGCAGTLFYVNLHKNQRGKAGK